MELILPAEPDECQPAHFGRCVLVPSILLVAPFRMRSVPNFRAAIHINGIKTQ